MIISKKQSSYETIVITIVSLLSLLQAIKIVAITEL